MLTGTEVLDRPARGPNMGVFSFPYIGVREKRQTTPRRWLTMRSGGVALPLHTGARDTFEI